MTLTSQQELIDNSTFSKVLSIYTRDFDKKLTSFVDKNSFKTERFWKSISSKFDDLDKTDDLKKRVTYRTISREHLDDNSAEDDVNDEDIIPEHFEDVDGLLVIEHQSLEESNQVRGLVMVDYKNISLDTKINQFHDYFSNLIVRDSKLSFSNNEQNFDLNKETASTIADFFAETLKNTTEHDLWDVKGRSYFVERTHYFTSRNLKIECVLPAFPCKSSNKEKVFGLFPDKGEEMALRRLIFVTKAIKEIYPPGLKVFIVSDGHVFSDCIGVDDDIVDEYTEKLKYLYNKIAETEENMFDFIGFVSLKDLFFNKMEKSFDIASLIEEVELPHYTGSKISEDSELSRRLLMAGCDTDAGKLRRDIQQPDHPRLHLYRGFSRFMTEDLALHPFCRTLSNKAFKKTVSKVAFEMIKRNDAYSNLVELLFPFHLRLSIHAHTNAGPKFGVRLISHDECRTIKALDSNEEPSFEDLLHIPTPWHNCVVKIDGHKTLYLTKTKIVSDAIEKGYYKGEWKQTKEDSGIGGHYHLTKI